MDPGGGGGVGRAGRAAAGERRGHGGRGRRELALGLRRHAARAVLLREVEVQRAFHAQLVFYYLFDKEYLL